LAATSAASVIAEELLSHRYAEAAVRKLLGEVVLRVMDRVLDG
jgi:microsomal dipeptidase-like Zn-dependent dipeptidase